MSESHHGSGMVWKKFSGPGGDALEQPQDTVGFTASFLMHIFAFMSQPSYFPCAASQFSRGVYVQSLSDFYCQNLDFMARTCDSYTLHDRPVSRNKMLVRSRSYFLPHHYLPSMTARSYHFILGESNLFIDAYL